MTSRVLDRARVVRLGPMVLTKLGVIAAFI